MSHQESKIFEGVMTRFWDDYGTAPTSKDHAGTIYFTQQYFNKSLFIQRLSEYFFLKYIISGSLEEFYSDCKSVNAGSIPTRASIILIFINKLTAKCRIFLHLVLRSTKGVA